MAEPTKVVDKGKAPQTNSQPKGAAIQKIVVTQNSKALKGNLKSTMSTLQNRLSSSRPNGQPTKVQPTKNNYSGGKPNNYSKGNYSRRRPNRFSNSQPGRFNKP